MTQPLPERCEAIKSLLHLLWYYLSFIPGAQITPRYGDAKPEPGPPPPVWSLIDCDGRCCLCEWSRECRGETWEGVQRVLDRKYRLCEIATALQRLDETVSHKQAHAIMATYVNPYDSPSEPVSECDRKRRLLAADAGVDWIARHTKGDFVGLGERKVPIDEQIVELRRKGFSYRYIQRQVGCSSKTVAELCAGKGYAESVHVL